jgi:hypothetical protein
MKKALTVILILVVFLLLQQSCSTIVQYSTFKSGVSYDDVGDKFLRFYSVDSIVFYIDEFLGWKIILSGPPLLLIFPNFIHNSNDKVLDYHIIISHNLLDTLGVKYFNFYRNNKQITPKLIKVDDQELNPCTFENDSDEFLMRPKILFV